MELDIYIICDGLERFRPELRIHSELKYHFKNVRVYQKSSKFDSDYIYIVKSGDYLLHPEKFYEVPIILIGMEVTDADFKGIQISPEYSPWEIFQTVQDLFLYYEKWNQDMLTAIATQKSINVIAELASQVLNKPYFIFDIAFKKICQAGKMPDIFENPDFANVMEFGYLPFEKKNGPKERVYSYEQCGRNLYPSIGTPENHTNMLLNIFVNRDFFAIFLSLDTMEHCSKGQISLMYRVRDFLEMAFSANLKNSKLEETSDYYVKKILDQEYVEEYTIRRILGQINWSKNGYFLIYTLCNQHGTPFDRVKLEFCLFRVKENLKNAIAIAYENYILIICKFAEVMDERAFTETLNQMLGEMVIYCGKSQRFHRFTDLKIYYHQTLMLFKYGLNSCFGRNLWDFQDEYFSCISNRLSEDSDLAIWVAPTVLKLHEYDLQNNTEYVKYLNTFLICGCNIKLTAQHLFFHRNTFIYRLEKIKQLLGVDVTTMTDEEKIQMLFACKLLSK